MKKRTPKSKIVVIGDPHYSQGRKKAILTAEDSICAILDLLNQREVTAPKPRCIITGDIFNKSPMVEERVMFASFLKRLFLYFSDVTLIKGTDSHEFTKGIYNLEDLIMLSDIRAVEELELGQFVFGHYEVKGTRYINGTLSQSQKEIDKAKTYVLGHIHNPSCSFENVNYVGSMYKTAFDQINDKKRIAIINDDDKIEWVEIASRPMFEVQLFGQEGKVKASGFKTLQETGLKEIDLKIKAVTDSSSLAATHRAIAKIKESFTVEYYQQTIQVNELKTDIPESLDQEALLRKYCELKKVPHALVAAELK